MNVKQFKKFLYTIPYNTEAKVIPFKKNRKIDYSVSVIKDGYNMRKRHFLFFYKFRSQLYKDIYNSMPYRYYNKKSLSSGVFNMLRKDNNVLIVINYKMYVVWNSPKD